VNVQLIPDRFLAVWTALGGDEFPFPLRYRTSARWEDEHLANMEAAERWRRETPDPALDHAIRTLLTGEVALEVHGRSADPAAEVSMRAAVHADRAVLADQEPPAGAIRLTSVAPGLLADAILDRLPPVPPGREPARTAPRREVFEPSDPTAVRRDPSGTTAEALRHLLRRDRSVTGCLRVLRHTPSGYLPSADIGWFDVVGDGRYLYLPGPDVRILPGTVDVFRRELSGRIERVRRSPQPPPVGALRPY